MEGDFTWSDPNERERKNKKNGERRPGVFLLTG